MKIIKSKSFFQSLLNFIGGSEFSIDKACEEFVFVDHSDTLDVKTLASQQISDRVKIIGGGETLDQNKILTNLCIKLLGKEEKKVPE